MSRHGRWLLLLLGIWIGEAVLGSTAVAATVEITPPGTIDFGVVELHAPPSMKTITLKNTGTTRLESVTVWFRDPVAVGAAGFVMLSPPSPFALAPEEAIDIEIGYQPNELGQHSANLFVAYAGTSMNILVVGKAVSGESGGCNASSPTHGGCVIAGLLALGWFRRRRR